MAAFITCYMVFDEGYPMFRYCAKERTEIEQQLRLDLPDWQEHFNLEIREVTMTWD